MGLHDCTKKVQTKMEDTDDEVEEILLCTVAVSAGMMHLDQNRGVKRRQRKVWVKEWFLRREERGAYNMIMQELRLQDAESFRKYLRMNTTVYEVCFLIILHMVITYNFITVLLLFVCFSSLFSLCGSLVLPVLPYLIIGSAFDLKKNNLMQEENNISKRKAMEGKVRKGKLWNGKRRKAMERLIVFGQ